ncbi:MAG: serine/threonine-protein kinase [Planctomycetota bacterium]|jgi:serine/threonine protein kinase
MPIAAGRRLGDYVLVERLGRGAFGEVWKAQHVHLPRVVALKIARDESGVVALEREATGQFLLDHPGIVKVLDLHLSGECPYVVLEYVKGVSLRHMLRSRTKLEVQDAREVFAQIVAALEHAHEQGVVHGDLKPENILISTPVGRTGRATDWVVKLTDFQVGRVDVVSSDIADEDPAESGIHMSLKTRGPIGTYRYLAPEIESGRCQPDQRVDLYSLGVILFELLTGEIPQGRDLPSDVNPAIMWWWDHVFSRCYTGRTRRYKSIAALKRDLRGTEVGPAWGDMPSQREAQVESAAAAVVAATQCAALPTDSQRCAGRRVGAVGQSSGVSSHVSHRSQASVAGLMTLALLALLVPFGVMATLGPALRSHAIQRRQQAEVQARLAKLQVRQHRQQASVSANESGAEEVRFLGDVTVGPGGIPPEVSRLVHRIVTLRHGLDALPLTASEATRFGHELRELRVQLRAVGFRAVERLENGRGSLEVIPVRARAASSDRGSVEGEMEPCGVEVGVRR